MMRPPRTIRAALLAGFLVIFAVWLASTSYFTRRLAETRERTAAIHERYARGQDLLSAVRSQVLLASIYARDALSGTDESLSAEAVRDQLRGLQAQVVGEVEQYKAIGSADEGGAWRQLETELRLFWETLIPEPGSTKDSAAARLAAH